MKINYLCVFQEPSLFAVAKLLETGLVNLSRVEVLWKPVTAHLLEVGASILSYDLSPLTFSGPDTTAIIWKRRVFSMKSFAK